MKRAHLVFPVAAALLLFAACDDSTSVKDPSSRAGNGPDAGPLIDSGTLDASDCFERPTTHFEIINACTNAVKIAKNPTLRRLLPDGGLPPLQ